jgi:Stc1 domain
MATEFSKNALELYRKQDKPLRCKQCVQEAAAQEREASVKASANAIASSSAAEADPGAEATRICAACQETRPQSSYNRNQWNNKKEGVSRCIRCIDAAAATEVTQSATALTAKLQAAEVAVEAAKRTGNTGKILQAESVLSALQAEQVTGLKPVRMNHKPRRTPMTRSKKL